ncbi:MAG: hypothetical protein PHG53_09440 [Phycisphaerae bacterium]|nr:hypothetical protein [Phycisphaerae bacterium]
MKREKQLFEGILTDKDLYTIEDAVVYNKNIGIIATKAADELILKLYTDFWEKNVGTVRKHSITSPRRTPRKSTCL